MTTFFDPFWGGWFAGTDVTALVPSQYDVALNGRALMLDLKSELVRPGEFRHVTIPLLRQQSDDSTSPSEASLNPDDLWRRGQESWHFGAGQTWRDRDVTPGVSEFRFRSSKGVDVWTKYEASLLPDTDQKDTSTDTNLRLIPAGARLYKIEGSTIAFTADVTVDSPTWTAVTYAGGAILGAASDGFHVYVTDGVNVYETDTGIATSSVFSTVDAGGLAYVKARLMLFGTGASKHSLYNPTRAAPNPAALFSHDNTDFTWTCFAEGKAAIYCGGFSGDKSYVYRLGIKPDASGLDQPIVAGELPDGEILRSMGGYLGFIFLGSDKGVHFARPDAQGNLEVGPLIETTAAVRCFEGQERFVWFGWTVYDGTSTGLGRLDLTHFTEPGVPAYASDLMVTAQGNVLSVCTFQNIRVFAVSGSGVWAETTDKVASGTMDTGPIGYGLPDTKTAVQLDVRTLALAGSYSIGLATDGGTFAQVGSGSSANSTGEEFLVGEPMGERFELRFTLTRSASAPTTGPTLTRWSLKVNPAAASHEYIYAPLLFADPLTTRSRSVKFDVDEALTEIEGLRETRQFVTWQELQRTYTVCVEDFERRVHHLQPEENKWNGTVVVKMKRI